MKTHALLLVLVVVWGSGMYLLNWWAEANPSPSGAGSQDIDPGQQVTRTILPGARPVIHAAQFRSLQEAIDQLPAEGGVVLVPPGEFTIDRPLLIERSDVLLQGMGTATHIKNVNSQGEPAIRIANPHGRNAPADRRPWRVMISNLRLTGNPQSGHGIEAVAVNELFLQGITVSYHGGDGIRLDHCYEDPRIADCLITYNKGVGLNLLGCHDIVVVGNQFEENQDGVHCVDGFNLCMTGNCLDDHLGNGVVIENTYGSVLAGNMIEECQGAAVILDRDCYGITISANVIAHNGQGIDLRDAHGCAVSANTFTINHRDALRVAAESGRLALTGNAFANSYIGQGMMKRDAEERAAGVTLHGTRQVVLAGNLFSSLRPNAIQVAVGTTHILSDGNLIVDCPDSEQSWSDSIQADNLVVP